eukprot:180202_1
MKVINKNEKHQYTQVNVLEYDLDEMNIYLTQDQIINHCANIEFSPSDKSKDDTNTDAPKVDEKPKQEEVPKNNDQQSKASEGQPEPQQNKENDKEKEKQKAKSDDGTAPKTGDADKDKPKEASLPPLKAIEYPKNEDQQLRYIYQTIKPAKDAEKYLTPKHFQDFLLNETREMLHDSAMGMFRDRIKQHIKFHKIPDGAWQGWYTANKDENKIKEIFEKYADKEDKSNIEVEDLMAKSGEKYEKKDSNFELRISSRAIRGSGRDELGNFSITGAFKGSDWSSPEASEFELHKAYPGKHTAKYYGH